MATTTSKLALTKPDGTDLVDIAVLNANADKIDAASGATICTSTTRPASPWNGQVIFETDTLNALVYRSAISSWAILGGSTVASDPPAGAGNGNFWWDSDNGKLYIYYNDGNSGQWVSVMPSQTAVDVASNVIINGAFDFWQRGTSGTYGSGNMSGADRWVCGSNSTTISRDADVPSGVSQYSLKIVASSANSIFQRIEASNIAHLAGQTVTFSFYYKRTAGTGNVDARFYYPSTVDNFTTVTQIGSTVVLSASPSSTWTRYSTTVTLPSNVTNGLQVLINSDGNTTSFIAGVQLEKGSLATSFKRNQPNIQAELAACQRYYFRFTQVSNVRIIGTAVNWSGGEAVFTMALPVNMRIEPTSASMSNVSSALFLGNNTNYTGASLTSAYGTTNTLSFVFALTQPLNLSTLFRPITGSILEVNAEL